MSIILFLISFIGVVLISNWIHECGHACGAKWCNYKNICVSIGIGKRLFSFRLFSVQWTFHAFFFIGGKTAYESRNTYQPIDVVLISVMGPLCNGIIVFILLLYTHMYEQYVLYLLFLFNAWLMLGNTLPIRWKDKSSDGYVALQMIYEQLRVPKKESEDI